MFPTRTFFAGALLAVAGAFAVVGIPELSSRLSYALDADRASETQKRLARIEDLSTAFQDVAEVAKPSVVHIRVTKEVVPTGAFGGGARGRLRLDPFGGGSPFDDLFRGAPHRRRAPFRQDGMGSGLILTEDGYIVTNHHVVADASEITVHLVDQRSFQAEVVGVDPKTDLAVIRIDQKGLHPARLADSDRLRVGQWVLAMGSPFGLTQTLTSGIVSATGRANMGIVDYEDFIQTDAAINPGNSGGPLLDLRGEVVGINTAIFSRSGGYMGIGFSIPANMVRQITDSLIAEGAVTRGFLGAGIQDLSPELAASFGYGSESSEKVVGVLVARLVEDGPAARAGIAEEDVIVAIDGEPVGTSQRLRALVAGIPPGSGVDVEILRDGERHTVTVEIGRLDDDPLASAGRGGDSRDLGLDLRELDRRQRRELGEGLLVESVEPGSAAERAGVRPGDLVLSAQGRALRKLADFRRTAAGHDFAKRPLRLKLKRGEASLYVAIKKVR